MRPVGEGGSDSDNGGTGPSAGGSGAAGETTGTFAGGPAGAGGGKPSGGAGETSGGAGGQGGESNNGDPWGAAGAHAGDDCTIAEPAFVPLADRRDVIIDEFRCKLYVSAKSGTVYEYDLRSKELAPLISFGTSLEGMDLSPNRGMLVVADANASPYAEDKRNYVHVVNVDTKASRTYYFPLESLESGTYMPLFIDTKRFLLTSSFAGSGWVPLRSVSVRDGSFEIIRSVSQSTMLSLSADGSTVAFAEPNSSGGPFGRLSLADGSFDTDRALWFVYEIAVNRDATQFAVPVYGGLYVYDYSGEQFGEPANLGSYSSHFAQGVAYSPDSDILYASMTGDKSSVEAYDSATLKPLFTLDNNPGLESVGNWSLRSGRMRIARNGEILAVTVRGGVKVYPARQPPAN